jgi:hypothetical protein
MSPSGLQKFLEGSEPYRHTAARLQLWYRAQPENLDTLTPTHAELAIQLLTGGLPINQRRSGTLLLIGALSALYTSHPPPWLVALRERYEKEELPAPSTESSQQLRRRGANL